MVKPTMLSIDWDFFVYNGELDKHTFTHPETGEAVEDYPGAFLYDWGHSEGHSAQMGNDILWPTRVVDFRQIGLDLERECNIREDLGGVTPEAFVSKVRKRWKKCGWLYMADSHAWGGRAAAALSLGGPLHVVHFDAHHDLGYRNGDESGVATEESWDCGNWLLAALRNGWAGSVEVVYPDWRGLREWEGVKRPWLDEFGLDVKVTTWSDWSHRRYKQEPFLAGAFACRSSAWTPPYMDEPFAERLIAPLSEWAAETTCLDHGDHTIGAYDACEPRGSWPQVLANAEQHAAARALALAAWEEGKR